MKILVISNLYPPHYIGGYELCCYDVTELLRAKGHSIKVLTSNHGIGRFEASGDTYRLLKVSLSWGKSGILETMVRLISSEIHNQRVFRKVCQEFSPDLIYIWNLSGLSMSLAFLAQRTGIPVTYYILDEWLLGYYKQKHRNITYRIGKRLFNLSLKMLKYEAGSGEIDFTHLVFVSQFLKNSYADTIPQAADTKVVHLGINIEQYPFKLKSKDPIRLLYVGQVVPHKGVHTLIEAMKIIGHYRDIALTIVGGTVFPDYETKLKALVESSDMRDRIRFTGPMTREAIAAIYSEHDILIFPSIWDEPLGMAPLEAMSSGLAVVGTGAGGSSEIFRNGINALTFPKEDAGSCACQILRLIDEPSLYDRIRQQGRRTVEEHFSWLAMINQIEDTLYEAAS